MPPCHFSSAISSTIPSFKILLIYILDQKIRSESAQRMSEHSDEAKVSVRNEVTETENESGECVFDRVCNVFYKKTLVVKYP